MGDISSKKYSGYKSFQYLEPGVDYKDIELTKEIGRVDQYQVPLTESEEKRVAELYRKCIVISLHDHAFCLPADLTQLSEWSREGRTNTAYEGFSVSCMDAIFDNLMDGFAFITSKASWH